MTSPAAGHQRIPVLADLCGVRMDFWKIYDQYYAKVRKFILANVRDEWAADDLIQETFIRIQKNLESLKDPSKMSSWIFSIAIISARIIFGKRGNPLHSELRTWSI